MQFVKALIKLKVFPSKTLPKFTSPRAQFSSRTNRDAPNETSAPGNCPTTMTQMRGKAQEGLASSMYVYDDVLGKAASENAQAEIHQMMEEAGTGKTATEEEVKATSKAKKKAEEEEKRKRNEMEVEEAKKAAEIEVEESAKTAQVDIGENSTSENEPTVTTMAQKMAEMKKREKEEGRMLSTIQRGKG